MGSTQLGKYTQGRAAQDLRQLTGGNQVNFDRYKGQLGNTGSYGGGMSRSQLFARMRQQDGQERQAAAATQAAADAAKAVEDAAAAKAAGCTVNQTWDAATQMCVNKVNTSWTSSYSGYGGNNSGGEYTEEGDGGYVPPDDDEYWNSVGSRNLGQAGGALVFARGGPVKKSEGFAEGGSASADLKALNLPSFQERLQQPIISAELPPADRYGNPIKEQTITAMPYNPSLRDNLRDELMALHGGYSADPLTRATALRRVEAEMEAAEWTPLVGELGDVSEAKKAVGEGRWGDALIYSTAGLLGTTPGVGDVASKPVRALADSGAVSRTAKEVGGVLGDLLDSAGNLIRGEATETGLESVTRLADQTEAAKMLQEAEEVANVSGGVSPTTVAPELGEAAKMLEEVDSIPVTTSNLSRAEKATLNRSAGRNKKLRAAASLAGENFKTNYAVDDGWVPVEITGAKFKNGNATVLAKKIPYAFQKPPEGVTVEEWSKQLSTGLVTDVENIIQRAKNGDQAAIDIIAQANWYRTMRDQLRAEFGGMGDVFADVIGATSAQTNVEQNFNNSIDIMRKYSRGDYDLELEAFERRMDQGLRIDGKTLIQMHNAGEFPLITKDSGAMFNSNSPAAMGALLDIFRNIKAGKSPKTPNFTGNLIGLTNEATIDVWAARRLRDLAGLPRIPPSAEQGVTGSHLVGSTLENPRVGQEFGFGQQVFRGAANELNKSGALKEVAPDLGDLGPDDLQAVVWFIEKENWAKNGWTTKSGEGGSLDYEMSFAGAPDQARVGELRRGINKGFKTPPKRKAETEAAYDLRVIDAKEAYDVERKTMQEELAQAPVALQRYQLGIAGERPNQPMSNYGQAEIAAELDDVVRGDPSVVGYNLSNTYGSFMGDTERALNAEFVVRQEFDPQPLRQRMIEQGKAYDQDAVFMSRAVPDGTAGSRPGVEIFFKQAMTPTQMATVAERLRTYGVDGFTYVTDARFADKVNRQTRTGDAETGALTGIRFQYIPEFDDSFVPQKAAESYKKAEDLFRNVVRDTIADGNVSDARLTYYDTEVYFRDGYDEHLSRAVKERNSGTR